jgi:hypothetical protein
MSRKQMIGDTRMRGPIERGASQTFPAGWDMALIARGTSPPNADCHETCAWLWSAQIPH